MYLFLYISTHLYHYIYANTYLYIYVYMNNYNLIVEFDLKVFIKGTLSVIA